MRRTLALFPLALALTGCGLDSPHSATLTGTSIHGTVHGGNQLVSGATIQLYAAGTTGYGSPATPLLTTSVTTGTQGQFNITGDYTCPSASSQVYLTATGGNPGLAPGTNNPALAMMTALGSCGSLSASTLIIVNEVTTVAAAFSLAQFMTDYAHLGASATNATGLANAFTTANTLVPSNYGNAIASATYNVNATAVYPNTRINSLANALAACVNTDGSTASGTPCALLFAATTPVGASAPTDTVAAALSVALHPTSQASALYAVTTANAPFQPTLSSAPTDWALSIAYSNTYLKYFQGVAVDSTGSFWNTQAYYTAYAKTFAPFYSQTVNFDGFGATAPAFDVSGKLWIGTSFNSSNVLEVYSPLSGQKLASYPVVGVSTATSHFDSLGNNWLTFGSTNATAVYSATGAPIVSSISGFAGTTADASGGMWGVSATDTLSRSTLAGTTVNTATYTGATGVGTTLALDHGGNLWSLTTSLLKFTPGTGVVTATSYPTYGSGYLAVDGDGNLWSTYGAGLQANKNDGSLLFPATGIAGPSNAGRSAVGLGINSSGDVWSICPANGFESSTNPYYVITDFIGVAAPVAMPLALAATNNTIGTRP